MKLFTNIFAVAVMCALAFASVGCNKAAEEAADGVEAGADATGDAVKDAAEDVKDAVTGDAKEGE